MKRMRIPLETLIKLVDDYNGKLVDLKLDTGEIISGILMNEEHEDVKSIPPLLKLFNDNMNEYTLCLFRTDVKHDLLSFIDMRSVVSININM